MLKLGPLLWRYVHRPLGLIEQSIKEGGPVEQRRTEAGRRAMIAAAAALPPLVDPGNPLPIAFSFLSGDKYWHQTIFCIVSLQQQCERRIDPVIHDDGSFTPAVRAQMRRVVPWIRFVDEAETTAAIDAHLPAERFPALRRRRLAYPHLRKLTDLHCAARGWTLVLDSDMLFFRRPTALIDWIVNPARPIYMQDVTTAYGYTPALLDELAGTTVPERVNVGLYSAEGRTIDWPRVEYWCAEQLAREGAHYFQEQALVATLLAGTGASPLPEADYVVMPSNGEGETPTAILHHYVAQSKRSYYRHGWRLITARATRRP